MSTASPKPADQTPILTALAGNPNAGKTTIFNALTGSHQHIGNWPGKTVERKEGTWRHDGKVIQVVDLPGTYSLTAHSAEEAVARDFLLDHRPAVVVAVADASNIERNLYLVLQLLELQANLVIALNMSDEAAARGVTIDADSLSRGLGGVPVVPTTASRGDGLDALREAILEAVDRPQPPCPPVDYGVPVREACTQLIEAIQDQAPLAALFPPRWLALHLLEGEPDLIGRLQAMPGTEALLARLREATDRLAPAHPAGIDLAIADRRYEFIHRLTQVAVRHTQPARRTQADRIDAVLTNPWLGIPLFLVVMYLVFGLVVNVSAPFLDWIVAVLRGPVTRWALALLTALQAPGWMTSLVTNGVLSGVGAVLAFIPGLVVLYLFLGVLEDSGYMARAAFVMDRLMGALGLPGKSFVPMALGFGCGVPAIYATRTLDSRRDRLVTALMVPLMSCSARLPVYLIFALAFFPLQAHLVIFGLYALGIMVAASAGLLFSRLLFRGQPRSAFLIELPPYRLPTFSNLRLSLRIRVGAFIRQAGTVILAASLAVWLLTNLPWGVSDLRSSAFGRVSAALVPAFAPAGFGRWEASGALLTGFVAKEMILSTLAQVTGGPALGAVSPALHLRDDLVEIGAGFLQATVQAGRELLQTLVPPLMSRAAPSQLSDDSLLRSLRANFTSASAAALLVFVLLYVPCIATLAALRAEFGWHWAAFSAIYQTSLAWLAAVAVFQIARLAGLG
jgi:ferrous iron transport protein B